MHKLAIASVLVLAGLAGHITSAQAHGCSGNGACSQDSIQYDQNQWQQQQQSQSVTAGASNNGNNAVSVSGGNSNYRSWEVHPVTVQANPIVTPAANVSRYVAGQCQPRQKIVHRAVEGVNNRLTKTERVELGYDQYLIPDMDQPYRTISLPDGSKQLIGHLVIETTAPLTVSASGGFGMGGNGNGGAGASFGVQSAGAMQRMVTTIRLQECLMATIAPAKPVAKPVTKPVAKPTPARKPVAKKPAPKAPSCNCQK